MARRGNMTDIVTEDMSKKWRQTLHATVFPSGIGEGRQFSTASATMNVDLANKYPGILNCKVFQVVSRLIVLIGGRPEAAIGLIEGPADISRPDFSASNIIGLCRYEPTYRQGLSLWMAV